MKGASKRKARCRTAFRTATAEDGQQAPNAEIDRIPESGPSAYDIHQLAEIVSWMLPTILGRRSCTVRPQTMQWVPSGRANLR